MAEAKTKPTEISVTEFLAGVEDPQKRADSHTLIAMMERLTGEKPKMWGPSIIGFGSFHYKYASGHEGDTCLTGFSPRKAEFSIYISAIPAEKRDQLLAKLGKHRMGKGCLYVKRLENVDFKVLEKLVQYSIDEARALYPAQK